MKRRTTSISTLRENQLSERRDDLPRGDVVDALQAMKTIDELLAPLGSNVDAACFRISGTRKTMSREEAERWLKESTAEGFSRVRFILHSLAGDRLEVELSASTPTGPATEFGPGIGRE